MHFVPTKIHGAFEVRPALRSDARGRFRRTWCEGAFAEAGIGARWVQMNHSVTLGKGSARGLHFQRPPHAEDKLVSCTKGRAFDVAVDLRRGSPTFRQWAAVEISEEASFLIPKGCAHGFQTLEEETHLVYLHSHAYTPDAEGGLRLDDPAIGLDWPLALSNLSERDRAFPLLTPDFEGLDP
jgi:dTDP-4-dehydrorhamnose 3,5-epimerase